MTGLPRGQGDDDLRGITHSVSRPATAAGQVRGWPSLLPTPKSAPQKMTVGRMSSRAITSQGWGGCSLLGERLVNSKHWPGANRRMSATGLTFSSRYSERSATLTAAPGGDRLAANGVLRHAGFGPPASGIFRSQFESGVVQQRRRLRHVQSGQVRHAHILGGDSPGYQQKTHRTA